ncbi:MAG: hypothetical protein DRG59_11145 [Deltaproteobacteria bacterium]|nr:MAG: hypothetical protein DRG59_11145 [Deltaproteobacteria bacterium]
MDFLVKKFESIIETMVEKNHHSAPWISKEELLSECWWAALKGLQKWKKSYQTRNLNSWIATAVKYALRDLYRREYIRRKREVPFTEHIDSILTECSTPDPFYEKRNTHETFNNE